MKDDLSKYRKKIAIEISNLIQRLLYYVDDEDEEIVKKFWIFLDKYEK